MLDDSLSGEVALVTGAGGRLGPIWVKALARAGATVHRMDLTIPRRDQPVLNWHQGDVTSADDVGRVLSEFGSLPPTILVNNAGVDSRPDTGALWARMREVNIGGTERMTRVFGAEMVKRQRGAIVNIASLYGLVAPDLRYYAHRADGWVKDPMYGATKAAVINLTKYYAAMFGPSGVRVNALAPGGVVAAGDGLTAQDPEFAAKYTARIPLGRMCQPEDLAGPLVFLASRLSQFVTGQVIALDGGYTCW